jgi:hypothetical protein
VVFADRTVAIWTLSVSYSALSMAEGSSDDLSLEKFVFFSGDLTWMAKGI